MTSLEDKKKHKEAAQKAWKTIRREKREKASKSSAKITLFINPEKLKKSAIPKQSVSRKKRGLPGAEIASLCPLTKLPLALHAVCFGN